MDRDSYREKSSIRTRGYEDVAVVLAAAVIVSSF